MYVIFLVQPDWSAANVTPCHKRGCIGAGSEGWRVQDSIASDSSWLLRLHACLGPLCLHGSITFLGCVWMTPLQGVRGKETAQSTISSCYYHEALSGLVLLSQQT